jgi:hypothetical protein
MIFMKKPVIFFWLVISSSFKKNLGENYGYILKLGLWFSWEPKFEAYGPP